jgi:two-component system CheB/CheR fusion protein
MMEVFQVEESMEIRPNGVYLLPPNRTFEIRLGKLIFMDIPSIIPTLLSADRFITIMANNFGNKSIIVIFSFDRVDGLLGIEAINQVKMAMQVSI